MPFVLDKVPYHAMKILIIDRSRFIRKTLSATLKSESDEVKCINSSGKALLDAVKWHPDAIITSALIDDMSGFDLCMLLKLMPDYAGIPVIIISSGEACEIEKKAADVGADYYVPKDKYLPERIRETLENACGQTSDVSANKITESREEARPGKVLIVDDSTIMRRIIRHTLSALGITSVAEAVNGTHALQQLEKEDIGLIMTDWNMPGMNGLELVKAVRTNEEYSDLPMVMVTTEGCEKERKLAFDAGANDILNKPFSREKLKGFITPYTKHIVIDGTEASDNTG